MEMGWNFDEIRKIRWIEYWVLEKENHSPEIIFKDFDFEILILYNLSKVIFFQENILYL
jgi:hypothetical protein